MSKMWSFLAGVHTEKENMLEEVDDGCVMPSSTSVCEGK